MGKEKYEKKIWKLVQMLGHIECDPLWEKHKCSVDGILFDLSKILEGRTARPRKWFR